MCLLVDNNYAINFVRESKRRKRKFVVRYKIVGREPYLNSYYITGPIYWFKYKPGYNKSNSNAKLKLDRPRNSRLEKGIHVLNTISGARNHWLMQRPGTHIIKVFCKVSDFIGGNSNESVFRGITIPKKEYDRCCNT